MKYPSLNFSLLAGAWLFLSGCHHGGHSCSPLHKGSGCPCHSGIDEHKPTSISRKAVNHERVSLDSSRAANELPRWGGEVEGVGGFARASSSGFTPEWQHASGLKPDAVSRAGSSRLSLDEPTRQMKTRLEYQTSTIRGQGGVDEPMTSTNSNSGNDGFARTSGGRVVFDPAVRAVNFAEAEPRLVHDESGQVIIEPETSWMTGTDPQRYPDEYLVDGGDRGYPVHTKLYQRHGLDNEDTIGECVDHTGRQRVVSSSQVAIYAPRFAAVRSVSAPSGDTAIEKIAGFEDLRRNSGLEKRIAPQRYAKADQAVNSAVRSRASGLKNRERQAGTVNVARLDSHTKLIKLRQDLAYAFRGEMLQSDEARLATGIDAALHWTRSENPVVLAQLDSLHQVTARFRAAAMVGVEDSRKTPGQLKIVKLADRTTAQPGDVITFIIRYDNTGDRELHQLRIVDNLTPRLEFIEDTATSDRPGDVIIEDNEEGSVVLTFKLDEPLPGKTGGVLTFQCRVR